ncbi:cytochrome P450 2W1 isoform X4 [Rhinolophus ferrumequinum]|uniref:cytochrome P450 2W1 isoform X4 n=1 Tax=Rhinolophus ferrumequinum TaxID=59479 RepID=UPI00140FB8E1|nr:cytochrome P450 2W1 isoform X4 [Rhinolophus ferrumequinum]
MALLLLGLLGLLGLLALLRACTRGPRPAPRWPPGPRPLPLIGNLHLLRVSQQDQSLMELSERFGPVFTVHLGWQKTVVLSGYEAVKEALVGTGQQLAGRPPIAIFQLIQGGGGIFFSSGARWKAARQFTVRTLHGLGVGRGPVADKVLQELRCLMGQLDHYGGRPFPLALLGWAPSNITFALLFGQRFDYRDPVFVSLLRLIAVQHLPPARGPPAAASACPAEDRGAASRPDDPPGGAPAARARGRPRALLRGRPAPAGPAGRRPGWPVCPDQRGGLCPGHGHGWHGDHLGHTAVGRPPDGQAPERAGCVQGVCRPSQRAGGRPPRPGGWRLPGTCPLPSPADRVQEELDRVLGPGRPPRPEDQRSLPYTTAVLHEVQRFITLLPHMPRCTVSDTRLHGYLLPKGTPVVPLLSSVLLDKTQWETPHQFNPGHFLDASGCFVKRAAFLPFSAGRRVCVGESLARTELFLLFAGLLQRFRLLPPPGLSPAGLDTTPRPAFTMRPPAQVLCAVPRHQGH